MKARSARAGLRLFSSVLLIGVVAGMQACSAPQPARPASASWASEWSAGVDAGPPTAPDAARVAPACLDLVRPGVVRRSAVVRVVDAGLGRWLGGVEVERRLEGGRFRGWTVLRLYPGDPCYTDLGLRPGDVVQTVNNHSIETPDAANQVFQSLRQAPSLLVKFLRGSDVRTLAVTIED